MTDTATLSPAPQVSDTFRITPSVYFWCALTEPRWLAAVAGPAVIVAGLLLTAWLRGDARLALVALIVLFIAMPLVMAMIYFNIAFSPGAAQSTLPHTVEIRPDGSLAIAYSDVDATLAGERRRLPHDEEISKEKIKDCRRKGKMLIYRLKEGGRLIIIPAGSLILNTADTCSFRDFD